MHVWTHTSMKKQKVQTSPNRPSFARKQLLAGACTKPLENTQLSLLCSQ